MDKDCVSLSDYAYYLPHPFPIPKQWRDSLHSRMKVKLDLPRVCSAAGIQLAEFLWTDATPADLLRRVRFVRFGVASYD